MKYGLLYYKDTDNIGDDIQSYAASQFLPKIDYMIDREHLNEFVPKKKEYVKTIMNAWYIHDKFNFGISPYINPLLISMFFKNFPYTSGITVGMDYINDNVKDILKKYGPVGTRDFHTQKMLNNLKVDNYFSGCMTLTINKFDNITQGEYIVVNGLTNEEIEYIKSKTNRKIIKFQQDIEKGSLSDESWEKRKNRVIDVLKLYQGAHMVITNKLHCSLPCLALETPVLLLYDKSFAENKDRIGTYKEYLNYIDRNKFMNQKINFENPKKNPDKYLEIRKKLVKECNNFIKNECDFDAKLLPDIDTYCNLTEKAITEKKVIIKHLEKLQCKYEKECEKSSKMFDEITKLNNEKQQLKEIEIEYNKILNSRSWKVITKIRKIIKHN
jgi:hypothetical protein